MAAPNAKFSDGFLDLIVIRQCPKSSLLALMTKLNNGGHVKSPYVLYLKGGPCDDYLSHLMCCCCSLVQEWCEIELRSLDGHQVNKMMPPTSQDMKP